MNDQAKTEFSYSQIPALLLLCNMGYKYLKADEAERLRGGSSNVLLIRVLEDHLRKSNKIEFRGKSYPVSNHNIWAAVQNISDLQMTNGLIQANEEIYRCLTRGAGFEELIEGTRMSFVLKYIDWEYPENNVYHIAEKFSVRLTGSNEEYRPDILLFVNGIPLVIIECQHPAPGKREADGKSVSQGIARHLRSQMKNGIPGLYAYSQLLLSLAVNRNMYGTTGTPKGLWGIWKETFDSREDEYEDEKRLFSVKNSSPDSDTFEALFSGRFRFVKSRFYALRKESRQPEDQDRMLWGICRPDRLLRVVRRYVVYKDGEKLIARYRQFHAVEKTLNRIAVIEWGKRTGGVISHAPGTGKTVALVMLARGIAFNIPASDTRIIIVSDRLEYNSWVLGMFDDMEMVKATTGSELKRLISRGRRILIVTTAAKFEKVLKSDEGIDESPNIFVLADDGHRILSRPESADTIQQTFPNACLIAFTGTPPMRIEKNIAQEFGGIIDSYPVSEAVNEQVIAPVLYHSRHLQEEINRSLAPAYIDRISTGMSDRKKTELIKQFSIAGKISEAEEKLMIICYDISEHFKNNWQGTGFKGVMTVPSRTVAVRCKQFMDQFGKISTEAFISAPETRDENEIAEESIDLVKRFWKKMMKRFGTGKDYHKQLNYRFRKTDDPEIMIITDKLIEGFNEPYNIVLYHAGNLKKHKLIQAFSCVNIPFMGKDFGFIVDYQETSYKLDDLADSDKEELVNLVTGIHEEIESLSGRHSSLWNIFSESERSFDREACESQLRDEVIRNEFYERFSHFLRTLKLALSSPEFIQDSDPELINEYKKDVLFFLSVRNSVKARYSDGVDPKYEKMVRKLIDIHIHIDTGDVDFFSLKEPVSIYETERFEEILGTLRSDEARADMVASHTADAINLKLEQDPALYKSYTGMLEQVISDRQSGRLSEAEYLERVQDVMDKVRTWDSDTPPELQGKKLARAIYGMINESFHFDENKNPQSGEPVSISIGLKIDEIVKSHLVVDWKMKPDVQKSMEQGIEDFLFSMRDLGFYFATEEIDEIINWSVDLARKNY